MRPAELSEPGQETTEVETESFSVEEELSRLDEITDEARAAPPRQTEEHSHEPDQRTSIEDTGDSSTSLVGRTLQWFKS